MHVQEFSLNQASLLSDGVFSVDPSENTPPLILPSYPTHRTESSSVLKTLQRILNRLGRMELPGADQLEAFLRHVARRNRRPRTLCSLWQSNMLFLCMLQGCGPARAGQHHESRRGSVYRAGAGPGDQDHDDPDAAGLRLRLPAVPGRGEGRLGGDLRPKDPPAASRAPAPGHGSRGSGKASLGH